MADPPLTETVKPKSLRLRLTLTYAFVFLLTGAALLAVNYGLMYNKLSTPPAADKVVVKEGVAVGNAPASGGDLVRLEAARTSAIALAIMTLLVVAASWVLAGRMLRPVRTLTATTRRISQDRLHLRIALAGPRNELKEMADTFDEMVARLEAAFASQRRFVGDVSHELRTPLAIVRTSAEVLLSKPETTTAQWRDMAGRVLIATGRAERLLDGLLALARSDSGAIVREPHDLAVAAAAALIAADDEAEAAQLSVTSDLSPAPVTGDPVLLDRLVRNLVDNAIRHNHHGGWIEVATSGGDDGAVVRVRNSGDTVPAADVDRLFQPFQRLRPDRTADGRSSGLGLAIVRSIVHAHRGTVAAQPLAGGGLQVVVTLPARDTPPAAAGD
ncbi:sensor histidine kinase [Dactylosporangium darangshiense]|uniref:histidine kinase n=1 Tax=Dactylosporangium darangshiense TaxID=579108 RepID=A0ABP8DDS2_9ACTN